MTDADLRLLIAGKARAVEAHDWYGLLGVEPDADDEELKRVYLQLVRLLHPDKLQRRDLGDLRVAAETVFKRLTEAHAVLSDGRRRAAYDASRAAARAGTISPKIMVRPSSSNRGESTPEGLSHDDLMTRPVESFRPMDRVEIAKALHQRGAQCFARGDVSMSERLFERARELDPKSASHSLKLGWAIFKNPERSVAERRSLGRRYLEHAAAQEPYNPEARYCLAQLFSATGDREACRRELEAVLRCQPDHRRAKVELNALRKAEEAAAASRPSAAGLGLKRHKRSGLLQRLLGR